MIIGIVSPALHVKSGYGIQAAHLARQLQADGHQVVVYAISGVGAGVLTIEGVTHYPGGRLSYQADVLERNVRDSRAQVVITLVDLCNQDAATMARLIQSGIQVMHWVPVDCEPLSVIDEAVLRHGGGQPVAMSRFGERMLRDAGFTPAYAPHCVDTGIFRPFPAEYRDELREDQGLTGKFVIGVNAANGDLSRKGFFEMWRGFAAFHKEHPDTVLQLHSELDGQFDHIHEIRSLGLEKAVLATDDHLMKTGRLDAGYMAAWYNTCDAGLMSSWGEGFGVPAIEFQACGVPVIATDCSALTELVQPGTGWRVPGELKPNPLHKRAWKAPWIKGIEQALTKAHAAWSRGGAAWAQRQDKARVFTEAYETSEVYERYWRPILAGLPGPGIAVSGGLKWHQAPDDHQFGDRLALDHEAALEPEVFRGLPADGVFVDVGAHVGHWTLRAAKRCKQVIAVEANPGTALRLAENLELNGLGNVTVHQVAAWDERARLYVHNHHGGAEHDGTDQVNATPGAVPVEAHRLDVLLADLDRVDVIKIDVEGADLHVIRGLTELLVQHRPRLFIEDHSVYGMYEKQELGDLLASLGYRWRDVTLGYVEAVPR